MIRLRITTALLSLITILPVSAAADTWGPFDKIESKPIEEVWLNPGFYSHHFDTSANFNNNNYGLGAEYRYSTVNSLTTGRYLNSDRKISNYAGLYWQPLGIGNFRLGALIGAIDGYPATKNGNWFLMALPIVSYEAEKIGFNLTIVPTITGLVYGAITIQLKLRVF